MTIGILQCGVPPEALRSQFGSYAAMVRRLLGPGRDTTMHDATRGALPASPAACDACVLTGSPAGVYEDLPWIAGLISFLREARGRAKLVGLCFGHQAMAQAFGGRVVKAPGWGAGLGRRVGAQGWGAGLGRRAAPLRRAAPRALDGRRAAC